MPEQSITMHILLWLKGLFLTYEESVIYNFILRLGNKVGNLFRKSCIRNLFVRKSKYEAGYEVSFFYYYFGKIAGAVLGFLKAIYNFFEVRSRGGIVRKVFDTVHDRGYFKFEYICAALMGFMLIVPHELWNNVYAVAMAVALGVVYIIVSLSGKRGFGLNVKAIPVSMIAFLSAIVIGVFTTPDFMDGARIALFYISSIVFTYVIYGSVNTKKSLKVFVTVISAALAVMCLYAMYQNHVGVAVDVRLTDITANSGMPGRVYSTMANPNNFAEIIILVVPFVYAMILCSKSKLAKLAFLAILGLSLATLAITYSRSCYVALVIATLVFVIIYDWRLIIPLGILAVLCVPFLPESIMNRIFTIGSMTDSSNSYRTYVWEGVIRLIKDNGILGIGIGPEAFVSTYPKYADIRALTVMHSHMLYMELFVELGLLGFAGFMGFMYSSLKKAFSTVNNTSKTLRCMIIAGISSFAGISFTACVEHIWFYPRVMFTFWVILGLMLAAVRMVKKQKAE